MGSLKSELCIRGRDLLYDRCKVFGIGYSKTEKVRTHLDEGQRS